MPDFDEMWGDVQEEIQVKDAEQDIISRVPELRQLSTDIDKATTAVINAKLSLESSIRQTQREEGVLGAAVNTISKKVDSINEHIDKVTVNVSDDDWEKMQKLHNQWMEQEKQILADQYKQQEVLWQKQSHRLTDIVRNNEGVWLSQRLFYIIYKQQEALWQKQSHRLTDIVSNNEGVWRSQRLFYIIGSLSLLSIITIVLEIAFYVYFYWIL